MTGMTSTMYVRSVTIGLWLWIRRNYFI